MAWTRNRMASAVVGAALAGAAMALASGPALAVDWIMASGYSEENFLTKNIRLFIDDVQKTSGVKIALNSNDSLIKLDAIKTAVQRGQVPIGEIRIGVYGNEDPMNILDGLPFIASTYAEAWLLKDLQKEYFAQKFAKDGMRVLFFGVWPGQGFYTKTPVATVADFKGKKLRIYSTATQKMGQMLGFNATILPFAEVPQAFSTGLIEALFTSPQTGIDIQAWDNTKYFTYAGAILSKNAVIVSERYFAALPEADKAAILAAAAKAEIRGWEMSAQTTAAQIKTLEKNGMTTANAPAEIITELKKIGLVMMDDWRKTASPEAVAVLDRYLAVQ